MAATTNTTNEPVALAPGDMLYVENLKDEPFTITWNGRPFALTPNRRRPVPFEAVAAWFGDPRSGGSVQSIRHENGEVAFVPDRDSERRRLRAKYGHILGDENSFMEHLVPHVKVTDLDDNEITTVLDDPTGTKSTAARPAARFSTDEELTDVVRRQAKVIQRLEAELDSRKNRDNISADELEPDEDYTNEDEVESDEDDLTTTLTREVEKAEADPKTSKDETEGPDKLPQRTVHRTTKK